MAIKKWGIEFPENREEFLPFWILGINVVGIIIYAAISPALWVAALSGVITIVAAVLTTLPSYRVGPRRRVPYIIYVVVIAFAFFVWGFEAALAASTGEEIQNTWIVPVTAAVLAGVSWFFKLRATPKPVLQRKKGPKSGSRPSPKAASEADTVGSPARKKPE
ncbi:hypothetical protein OVA06_01725 [Pseudarthrobacter sp. SL88]|uniref:hypothetical protein n=1 Tax=Pseudarthrobacter sp. SL88 TaxID=2994666 RepID=UPI002275E817|nr:hypothetical protein [Pseudarthrobacter sp. SL88]MCY1673443.1 hypothetical protein [Pseudarthrobacter sp. SL88]